MHAITIAARNYLPFARILARSFKKHNPDASFVVLVVDAAPGELPDEQDFEIAGPQDLSLDPVEFRRMAFLYNITELSTSLKPWALEMLLDRGADVAVYLDPDILVYSSLSEIAALSHRHGIVLTPHAATPMQRDGLRPTEADIMGAGVYNLGFIAVGSGNRPMLQWWQERLRRDSISAPHQMLFTDQRWIDLVPSYWEHVILRDPGYNVAYWNLESRPMERIGSEIKVAGHPLRFFHFSGYRPEKPWLLSKYVADNPRVVLSEHPVVKGLCDDYGAQAEAEGLADGALVPYRYNTLTDGTPVTGTMRNLYRAAVLQADRGEGDYPPPAFDPATEHELASWFRDGQRGGPNRLLRAVWQERGDLQAAFPRGLTSDASALLDWARTAGVAEGEIPVSLLPPVGHDALAGIATVRTDTPGLNLAGYFAAELGMGQSARLLVDAVSAAGYPFSTIVSERTVSRQQAKFSAVDDGTRYPINVAVVNADQFGLWSQDVGADLLADRYTIGMWAWEVEEFPDIYDGAFNLVDEIWAISRFVRDAIAAKTDKPVYVFPHPIPVPNLKTIIPLDREPLGLSEESYFLFVFDYLSVFERKNPLAVVRAFTSAFSDLEGPQLVIKTINGHRCQTDRERLRLACIARSDIKLIEEYLDSDVLESLMANATAYVSLHRSEGYGHTMSEAMSLGRPVIATAYSGNMDFMDESNSLLVPYELVRVGQGSGPYPTSTHWAEPDSAVAARFMRRLIDDPDYCRVMGRRARLSVERSGSVGVAAGFVRERVEVILTSSRNNRVSDTASIQASVDAARQLIHTPPDVDSPSRFPIAARRLRQLGYRLSAHHDEHVNRRLDALADAIGETARASTVDAELFRLVGARLTDQIANLKWGSADAAALWGSTGNRLVEQEQRLSALVDRSDDINARVEAQVARIDVLSTLSDELNAITEAQGDINRDLTSRLDGWGGELQAIDQEMKARPFMADGQSLEQELADGRRVLGFASGGDGQDNYAGFEDIFRGSEVFIQDRLRPYLPLLEAHGPVLDVGCGRGELLSLLAESGINATGVDIDESMLARARAKGVSVVLDDAVEYMDSLEKESLGAVVSFQVIEHLPVEVLRHLLTSAMRVLRPGGVLIAETVNPHSPPALKTFWLDLTHVRPLYPESMLLLARECGYDRGEIFFPRTTGDLDRDLRVSGEYSLVAYRD
jgi:SAM-dependent methyltransferase/glycosyltransferase involved in cell wall biosynthesis